VNFVLPDLPAYLSRPTSGSRSPLGVVESRFSRLPFVPITDNVFDKLMLICSKVFACILVKDSLKC